MKKIFFFLLALIALHSQAQIKYVSAYTVPLAGIDSIYQSGDTITTCKSDTVKAGYFKDSVKCYSVVVPKTCYDTIPKTCFDTLKKTCYDTTYTTVISNCRKVKTGGWWWWNKYKTVCDTTKKMNVTSRSCNVISSRSCPVISSRDCSTSYIQCDTLSNYFYIPPVVAAHCDTTIVIPVSTIFGINPNDGVTDDQIALMDSFNVSVIRANPVELYSYVSGVSKYQRIIDLYNAGIKNFVNLNWYVNSKAKPYGFCQDTALYRKKIRAFLADYSKYIYCGVIENEPSNDQYYGATVNLADYVALLTIAADECYKAGILCIDGCLHIEPVYNISTGIKSTNKTVIDQKYLLSKYKYIPHLSGVNVHKAIIGSELSHDQIVKSVNYISTVTGLPVYSNEFHGESATQTALNSAVQGFKDAKVKYVIIFGGGGQSPADPINGITNPTTKVVSNVRYITPFGNWYRNAIKQ